MKYTILFLLLTILFASCQKDPDTSEPIPTTTAKLRFKFKFDKNQTRLDNLGNETPMPSGHAGLSPDFNAMSAYFIELVPTQFTQIREGAVIYEAETQASEAGSNFEKAVIFDEAIVRDEGTVILEIPIKDIAPGTYNYLRASVTYQNADVRFNLKNLPAPLPSELNDQTGTFAGFIGFNSYIDDLKVKNKTISVNADKTQGFWAFEPQLEPPYQDLYETYVNPIGVITGQAPAGSTTVVNILEVFGVTLPFGFLYCHRRSGEWIDHHRNRRGRHYIDFIFFNQQKF